MIRQYWCWLLTRHAPTTEVIFGSVHAEYLTRCRCGRVNTLTRRNRAKTSHKHNRQERKVRRG